MIFPEKLPKKSPKAVSRNYVPEFFPQAPLQSDCPKAIMLQMYSPRGSWSRTFRRSHTYHFLALLCNTKGLHTSSSQNHFVLLCCTAMVAHTSLQHHFVLQPLHRECCMTRHAKSMFHFFTTKNYTNDLYYKACTKALAAFIYTTKVAQRLSQ